MIIDTKRRSTSFEHRLLKYYRNYNIGLLFPGVSQEILDILYNKIIELAKEYNYAPTCPFHKEYIKEMFVGT